MTTDLESARLEVKSGDQAAALLSLFETAEQRSKAGFDSAERHLIDLRDRRTRIDEDRKRATEFRDALTPLDIQEQAVRSMIQQARDEIAALDTRAEQEEAHELNLQRLVTAVARNDARASLAHQQRGLEELGERLVKNGAALANNRATSAVMTSLDAAERELSLLITRLEAAAPEVEIGLGVTGAGLVSIGETPVVGKVVQAVINPLTIKVRDVATITVLPRSTTSSTDQKKRQEAQKRLSKLIEDTWVASAAELRAARARRQALEEEAVGLQAEINAFGICVWICSDNGFYRGHVPAQAGRAICSFSQPTIIFRTSS
jgi:hypothetical protein